MVRPHLVDPRVVDALWTPPVRSGARCDHLRSARSTGATIRTRTGVIILGIIELLQSARSRYVVWRVGHHSSGAACCAAPDTLSSRPGTRPPRTVAAALARRIPVPDGEAWGGRNQNHGCQMGAGPMFRVEQAPHSAGEHWWCTCRPCPRPAGSLPRAAAGSAPGSAAWRPAGPGPAGTV